MAAIGGKPIAAIGGEGGKRTVKERGRKVERIIMHVAETFPEKPLPPVSTCTCMCEGFMEVSCLSQT